jgi:hypothetical protein
VVYVKKGTIILSIALILVLSISVAADGGFLTTIWDLIVKFFSGTPTGAVGFGTAASVGACFTASTVPVVPGETIDLTNDISTGSGNCAVMDVSGTILDCHGFTISNSGTATDGIRITASDVIIQNCIVSGFDGDNIEVTSTGDNFVITNTTSKDLTGFLSRGLRIAGTSNGVVESSTFSNIDNFLITTSVDSDLRIEDNFFDGNGLTDLLITSCSGCNLSNNTWTTDRDNETDSVLAVGVVSSNNFNFVNHRNFSMWAQMSGEGFNVSNNTLLNNGLIEIGVTGAFYLIPNFVHDNSWANVAIQGRTSGGIIVNGAYAIPSQIYNNRISNGQMMSVSVDSNVQVFNNTIANVTGIGFEMYGQNSSVFNNTVTNFSGSVFKIVNATVGVTPYNNSIINNTVQFNLKVLNTTFNLANLSTPPLSEGTNGVLFSGPSGLTLIENNLFNVSNPQNLPVGVIGVRSSGEAVEINVSGNTFIGLQSGVSLVNASNSAVANNSFRNSTFKAVILESGQNISVFGNAVLASLPQVISGTVAGIQLWRMNGFFEVYENNISGYDSGLYLLSANNGVVSNIMVDSTPGNGYGVFSVSSLNNTFQNITVDSSVETGVKFLYSNNSFINGSTFDSSVSSAEFYFSNNNNLNESSLQNAVTGLLFDLFSSSNSVNNNVFSGNSFVDILYDMFASANTGAGNGGPSEMSEDGAAGNFIT